jgi:hypothetical protein
MDSISLCTLDCTCDRYYGEFITAIATLVLIQVSKIFMLAAYLIYVSVFSYLADCYGPFASSALAGQSLARTFLFLLSFFISYM